MGRYGRGLIGPATNLPKNHASNHKNYNTRFDIEDTISIPIKSQRRKTPASSQTGTFWQKSSRFVCR